MNNANQIDMEDRLVEMEPEDRFNFSSNLGYICSKNPRRNDEKCVSYLYIDPSCDLESLAGSFNALLYIICDIVLNNDSKECCIHLKNDQSKLSHSIIASFDEYHNLIAMSTQEHISHLSKFIFDRISSYSKSFGIVLKNDTMRFNSSKLDRLLLQLNAALRRPPHLEFPLLFYHGIYTSQMTESVRLKVELIMTNFESNVQETIKCNKLNNICYPNWIVVGTCVYWNMYSIFCNIDGKIFNAVSSYLLINVFSHNSKDAETVFYEHITSSFEGDESISFFVFKVNNSCLVTVLSSELTEPPTEIIRLSRQCVSDVRDLIIDSNTVPEPKLSCDFTRFLSEFKTKQDKLLIWVRSVSSKKFRLPFSTSVESAQSVINDKCIDRGSMNSVLSVLLIDKTSSSILFSPTIAENTSLSRLLLRQFLYKCFKQRPLLNRLLSNDPKGVAELGIYVRFRCPPELFQVDNIKESLDFSYWIVGHSEKDKDCFVAFHESVPQNIKEVMLQCQKMMMGLA